MKRNAMVLAIGAGVSMIAVDVAAVEISPRGRVHVDFSAHEEDKRELGDGFRARRARIGLSGKIDDDWSFKIEYDFAENSASAKDAYLRYSGLEAGNITVGHFKVPFGLEELTSSNSVTLIERSLPTTTFAQSRRLGVSYNTSGENWTFGLMGFGQGQGSGVRGSKADEGLGVGGRLTFTPIKNDENLFHLGLAATTESPADKNAKVVRFRTRPESRPTNERLIDTGNIGDVSSINQVGLEAAWKSGPFSVQSEWMRSSLSRSVQTDVDLDGWYISGSWVLTGESRGYRGGVFRGVSPSGPGGAWELTARYSSVNLNDGPVLGGDEQNWTLGANWYANSRVRFMFNYIDVSSERQGIPDGPGILLARAQVSF